MRARQQRQSTVLIKLRAGQPPGHPELAMNPAQRDARSFYGGLNGELLAA
jgi:hypothetical protein